MTWRLVGTLPAGRHFTPSMTTSGKAFVAMDRLLDNTRTGPLHLKRPEIASMVVDAIQYEDRTLGHYRLHNYVVMANHVHLLITPHVPVSKLMQSLKRFTGLEANRMMSQPGHAFWQHESYDRLVRDAAEFERIAAYIEMNPVRAGLVSAAQEFRWSSAWSAAVERRLETAAPVGNRPHFATSPRARSGRGPAC